MLVEVHAAGKLLWAPMQVSAAQTSPNALIFFLVFRLYKVGNSGQQVKFQELRRPIHLIQNGRHTLQPHFLQLTQQGIEKLFSVEYHLPPPLPLPCARIWLRERKRSMSMDSAPMTKASLLRSSLTAVL